MKVSAGSSQPIPASAESQLAVPGSWSAGNDRPGPLVETSWLITRTGRRPDCENWANRKTLILGRSEMIGPPQPGEYNDCVEQAYRMHGEGRFYMDPRATSCSTASPANGRRCPPTSRSRMPPPANGFRSASGTASGSTCRRSSRSSSTPIPETGFPLAIVDGSYHTVMRTGAAAAVSAKWMARKNSRTLAIVGAGHMAEGALATCNEVFPWAGGQRLEPQPEDARPFREGAAAEISRLRDRAVDRIWRRRCAAPTWS